MDLNNKKMTNHSPSPAGTNITVATEKKEVVQEWGQLLKADHNARYE